MIARNVPRLPAWPTCTSSVAALLACLEGSPLDLEELTRAHASQRGKAASRYVTDRALLEANQAELVTVWEHGLDAKRTAALTPKGRAVNLARQVKDPEDRHVLYALVRYGSMDLAGVTEVALAWRGHQRERLARRALDRLARLGIVDAVATLNVVRDPILRGLRRLWTVTR